MHRLRTRLRPVGAIARHPLVLLAAGAVVSGLLVPSLTRGAQNHRQALDIKSELVTSMSAAASPFLAATLANVLVYRGNVPRSYDSAYQQWFERSANVGTKLQTYYPDEDVTPRWFGLTFRMRDLYYFFRLSTPDARGSETRTDYVRRLKYFVAGVSTCTRDDPGGCPSVDFGTIDLWLARPQRRFDDVVNHSMEELLIAFRVELNDITRAVLDGNPRL
jgi:hypothetical protein